MDLRPSSIFWTILAVIIVVFIYEYKAMKKAFNDQCKFNSGNVSEPRLSSKMNIPETPKCLKSPQLYTFGGIDEKGDYLFSASRLNSTSGKWQSINRMQTQRSEFCGAVMNDKIYLFGGFKGSKGKTIMMDTVNVYDSSTDTYKTLQPMPGNRQGCGAAVLNDYIYVAGGYTGEAWYYIYQTLSSVIQYNIHTDKWTTVASMNTPRHGVQLVELGGLLYAIGGLRTKSIEVYNPTTDRWSYVTSTKDEHFYTGVTVYKKKIYALGSRKFEVFSPVTNQWTTLNFPTEDDTDYFGTTLVTMNDKLWAMGGHDWEDSPAKAVHTYDLSTGQWTKQQDMDVYRKFSSAFVVDH